MPRAGTTPAPAYKKGDSLAQGQAQAANNLVIPRNPNIDEQTTYQPQGDAQNYIFGPTDRPHEPITAGAPFGAGPLTMRGTLQTDDDVTKTVAMQLQQDTGAGKDAKQWAQRALQGD